mmetsp:Transcript_15912/g.55402  ORF Transcript_15912/g.55402 Transcript_15912/m.55402 type:complete len:238 (+) Transcript_15912:564-1277(+)
MLSVRCVLEGLVCRLSRLVAPQQRLNDALSDRTVSLAVRARRRQQTRDVNVLLMARPAERRQSPRARLPPVDASSHVRPREQPHDVEVPSPTRDVQDGVAVLVSGDRVEVVVAQKLLNDADVAVPARRDQRRLTKVATRSVDVDRLAPSHAVEQQRHHTIMPICARPPQRRLSIIPCAVDVDVAHEVDRLVVAEGFQHIQVPVPAGRGERRLACLTIRVVDVGDAAHVAARELGHNI